MANSTHSLPLISASQANKEVTANGLFLAASPALVYGRNPVTSNALTWGYLEGAVMVADGSVVQIAAGTVTLTASSTNYVEADPDTGAVSVNTTGFTSGAKQLYSVVTGGSTVSSYMDYRTLGGGSGGGVDETAIGDAIAAHEAQSNPHPNYLTQTEGDALYEATGAVAAHAAAGDPHPQYLTQTEADALYSGSGSVSAAIAAHEAASDPHPGYLTQAEGDARYLQSTGSQPFDVHAFYPGVPSASAVVLRVPLARTVTFASAFSGSYARSSVAATGSTVFDVQKNGASVGSITFAASATTGSFSTVGAGASFAAGDILSIHAPGTADATIANVGIVLAGTR